MEIKHRKISVHGGDKLKKFLAVGTAKTWRWSTGGWKEGEGKGARMTLDFWSK